MQKGEFNFNIVRLGAKIGKTSDKGWSREINRVSWYGKEEKWDIRPWNEDHTKCGSGITLEDAEAVVLLGFLKENTSRIV